MKNSDLIVLAALAAGWWYWSQPADSAKPAPTPDQPCPGPGPCPLPAPKPQPKPKPKPWGDLERAPVGDQLAGQWFGASVGGNVAPDGTEIQIDLPGSLHQKNSVGRDNLGLCVYASGKHTGHWQNNKVFVELFDWMKQRDGGSYPAKFDRDVEAFCQERGIPKPAYLQVEGKDLEILKLACRTGRMPGVTYSVSPTGRYNGQRIAHMVSLPHADNKFFCVLDNNYPGPDQYEWMTEAEFMKAYTGGKSGWAIILLDPPPPPAPRN